MAAPQRRSLYGSRDTYLVVWNSLADVLVGLEDIDTDFAEYKYRDSLVEQVKWSKVNIYIVLSYNKSVSKMLKYDTCFARITQFYTHNVM